MEYGDRMKNVSERDTAPQSLIAWEDFGYEKVDNINFGELDKRMPKLKKDDNFFLSKLKESTSGRNKFSEEKMINNVFIDELHNSKIENEYIVIPRAVQLFQSNCVDGIIYEYFNDSSEKYGYSDEKKISILLFVDEFIKSIPISERLKTSLRKRTIKEYRDDLDRFIVSGNNEIKSMAIKLKELFCVDYFELCDEVLNHGDLDMSNIGYDPKTQKIAIFDLEALCVGNSINALAHCSYQSVLYKISNRRIDKDKCQIKRWDLIAGPDFYKIVESKIMDMKFLEQFYGVNMFYAIGECYDGLSNINNDKLKEIELDENMKFFYDNLEKLNKIAPIR